MNDTIRRARSQLACGVKPEQVLDEVYHTGVDRGISWTMLVVSAIVLGVLLCSRSW